MAARKKNLKLQAMDSLSLGAKFGLGALAADASEKARSVSKADGSIVDKSEAVLKSLDFVGALWVTVISSLLFFIGNSFGLFKS